MIVECPKCHAENKDDSKHCGNCAAPLGPGAASLGLVVAAAGGWDWQSLLRASRHR